MSFGRPTSRGEGNGDGRSQHALGAAQYFPRPCSARPACRGSGRFDSLRKPDNARCEVGVPGNRTRLLLLVRGNFLSRQD